MSLRLNPFYTQIRERLDDAGASILSPWEGYV